MLHYFARDFFNLTALSALRNATHVDVYVIDHLYYNTSLSQRHQVGNCWTFTERVVLGLLGIFCPICSIPRVVCLSVWKIARCEETGSLLDF